MPDPVSSMRGNFYIVHSTHSQMRPEFDPEIADRPVSIYDLDEHQCSKPLQMAIADNGIIAFACMDRTIHLFDKQYRPLHAFTYCDKNRRDDCHGDVVPTQMAFDASGNILLASTDPMSKAHQCLQRYNCNGKLLPVMSIPEAVQSSLAEKDGSHYEVTGVTRDLQGNVFFRLIQILHDDSVARVYMCKHANGSGVPTVLSDYSFGDYDEEGEYVLQYCNPVACGPGDRLYAISPDGIQEFDTTSGNTLQTVSLQPLPIDDESIPKVCFDMTITADGLIFVVLMGEPYVYILSQDGSYLNKLLTPCVHSASATAIDQDGFLHVLNPSAACVYVY